MEYDTEAKEKAEGSLYAELLWRVANNNTVLTDYAMTAHLFFKNNLIYFLQSLKISTHSYLYKNVTINSNKWS